MFFYDCQATYLWSLIIIDFFNIQLYNLLRHWDSFHHNRLLTEYWNDFLFIIPQGVLPQYFTVYQRRMCNMRLRYLFRKLRCWLLSCFLKFSVFDFFFQHEHPSFSYVFECGWKRNFQCPNCSWEMNQWQIKTVLREYGDYVDIPQLTLVRVMFTVLCGHAVVHFWSHEPVSIWHCSYTESGKWLTMQFLEF